MSERLFMIAGSDKGLGRELLRAAQDYMNRMACEAVRAEGLTPRPGSKYVIPLPWLLRRPIDADTNLVEEANLIEALVYMAFEGVDAGGARPAIWLHQGEHDCFFAELPIEHKSVADSESGATTT